MQLSRSTLFIISLYAGLVPNLLKAEESATNLLPVVFFTRDTGLGLGGFLVSNLDRPQEGDPSQVLGLLSYTSKKQTIALLEPRLYSEDRTWEYGGRLYAQDYPNTFYGREDETLDPGETFKERRAQMSLRLTYRAPHQLFVEGEADLMQSRFLDFADSPNLSQEFAIWGPELKQKSGTLALGYDSRPGRIRPDRGLLVKLSHRLGEATTDRKETRIAQSALESRYYYSFNSQNTLALQGLLAEIDPQPLPFYQLLGLGGSALLRGYAAQQFRDYAIGLAQAEFRSLPSERWGYHVFAGLGDTAEHKTKLAAGELHGSAGLGFDYIVDVRSKQNFRFDIGLGQKSYGLYLLFGNAF